ncbi:hypothetical protein HAX54_035671 [Datura stramonium]|uniref:Pectinesterase inhibitor domain-containing protein n=1 Tax=Datura stramonium TaxID=4076 RepID=A0ABS8VJK3_DATST|nr:hypothetical protein [Datura stramonium]
MPYASSVKANSTNLCKEALNVATKGARDASIIVSNLKKQKGISRIEAAAIKDCIEDVKDAMYELKLAVEAMGHLGDKDKEFQLSNAKTYASAAITDADSCIDGFSNSKLTNTSRPTYTYLVKTKCNITTYPSLCLENTNALCYASSVKTNSTTLCKEALKVAIKGARDVNNL